MRLLYEATNVVEATLLKIELEKADINVFLFNRYAQGASGELPVNLSGPQIWLENEQQWNQASEIVRKFDFRRDSSSIIFCPVCHEQNPANFTICWNCNHEL